MSDLTADIHIIIAMFSIFPPHTHTHTHKRVVQFTNVLCVCVYVCMCIASLLLRTEVIHQLTR
jgi:hypothetical protein